jgi:hypothetical protein
MIDFRDGSDSAAPTTRPARPTSFYSRLEKDEAEDEAEKDEAELDGFAIL